MPQKTASHLGLVCLLRKISSKNGIKIENTPYAHKNDSGLTQMKMMDSIHYIWVNDFSVAERVLCHPPVFPESKVTISGSLGHYKGGARSRGA